jgi:hypothetical protein
MRKWATGMRWSPDGTYEILLISEFIGASECWFYEVSRGTRKVLIPCGGHADHEAFTLAHLIGELFADTEGARDPTVISAERST